MQKEEIQIQQVIVHIMDSSVGMPVLSQQAADWGPDLGDFLRSHIFRIMESDEAKECTFQEDSQVGILLKEYEGRDWTPQEFADLTGRIGEMLYRIMNRNIEIPPADLLAVAYRMEHRPFLALLKMNYKTYYTHQTDSDPWGNHNSIIRQKAILPGENQKLAEAALIGLDDGSIRLVEKKYSVNGKKCNYFSEEFLQCRGPMSPKSRLAAVTRAVEEVQKMYYHESEQYQVQMETRSIMNRALEEGSFQVPELMDRIFKEQQEMKDEAVKKLDRYHLSQARVETRNPATGKKFEKQNLITDTGIEIRIPMDQYNNKNSVDFITNPDGTISVLIKNIGSITSR